MHRPEHPIWLCESSCYLLQYVFCSRSSDLTLLTNSPRKRRRQGFRRAAKEFRRRRSLISKRPDSRFPLVSFILPPSALSPPCPFGSSRSTVGTVTDGCDRTYTHDRRPKKRASGGKAWSVPMQSLSLILSRPVSAQLPLHQDACLCFQLLALGTFTDARYLRGL